MTSTNNPPESWLLTKVGLRRKVFAFLTVAAATFLLLGLFWPLATSGYSSRSAIEIGLAQRTDAPQKFKSVLSDVLDRQTSPKAIQSLLETRGIGENLQPKQKQALAKLLRDRLNVSIREVSNSNSNLAIDINLRGTGTPREDFLVNLMATEMARDFMTSPLAALLPSDTTDNTRQLADLESRRLQSRQQAEALIVQIEGNLNAVRQTLRSGQDKVASNESEFDFELDEPSSFDEMAKSDLDDRLRGLINQRAQLLTQTSEFDPQVIEVNRQIDETRSELDELNAFKAPESKFRTASYAKSKTFGTDNVEAQLNQVDVGSLRETINQLAAVASEATLAAETGSGGPVFSIEGVNAQPAAPIGGVPSQPQFVMLGFFSLFFAGLVAMFFKPFTEKGFENVDSVSQQLGLPVLATIDSRYRHDDTTGTGIIETAALKDAPMSNQIVKACEIALFVVCMLVIGFCLVNSDVRSAFWENPFHGFSRIVWMFRGN